MFTNRSSKSGKRGFGQRRTIVQLEDEPRRQPTYGFGYKPVDEVMKPEAGSNALSGLMSQYAMDSFSDDNSDGDDGDNLAVEPASHINDHRKEKKQWPQFVAATDTQLPTVRVSDSAAANEKSTKSLGNATSESVGAAAASSDVKDDIDTKLKNFLAEIESIDVPEMPANTETTSDETPRETVPDCDADNGIGTSEDDLNAPVEPQPPTTVWQHCLDEGTQCYYYWNTETNEVTWEIPAEFSQYLLRHKEYERLMTKYEKEMTEWRKIHGTRKSKKSIKKERKRKKKVEEGDEVIEPLVSYPPIEEEEEEELVSEKGASVVYGPEKPPDELLEKMVCGDLAEPEQDLEKPAVGSADEERCDAKASCPLVTHEAEALSVEGDLTQEAPVKKHHHKSSKMHAEEEVVTSSEKAFSHEHKAKSLDHGSKVKQQSDQSNDDKDRKANSTNSESVSKFQDVVMLSPEKPNTEEIDDDEEEFVNRELEEPIFTHYEYVNKKFTEDQNDDTNLAIEEIDRELELALKKQQSEADALEGEKKRKYECMENSGDRYAKRQKTETESDRLVSGTWISSLKDDIKFKFDELTEVLDLSSTIMEKLEFLEVPQIDWSNLQVLLIQMETRLMDWKNGGLSTEYLLQRLNESANVLCQYEQTSCPPGWSCCWDRDFKRYFYSNNSTGETSWTYPEVGRDQLKSSEDRGSSVAYTLSKSSGIVGFNRNLQTSGDNVLPVSVIESSGCAEEPGLSINVPSDLLTWAANPPPPPPPETPPPPSPHSETRTPRHSPTQVSDNEMAPDDDCFCVDDEILSQDKEDHLDGQTSTVSDASSVSLATVQQTLPHQIVAGPVVGRSPLPAAIPVATSPEGSVDNSVSVASADVAQPVAHDDQYDGTPMDEQIAHPVKEKKKKKEKLLVGSSLSMKKKNVSSLVEKWQKIQDDVSKEIEHERSKQMKLAELAGKTASSKTD